MPFPEHPFKWGMRFGVPRLFGVRLALGFALLGCAAAQPEPPHAASSTASAVSAFEAGAVAPASPFQPPREPPPAAIAWSYRAGAPLAAPAAVGPDGTVVVGSVDGYLHALRGDGSFRWGYTLRGPLVGRPAIGLHGAVFAAADPNGLYALDGEGTLLWVSSVVGGVSSPPVVDLSSKVWVATGQGTLLGFSSHGGLAGFARLGAAPTLGPAPLPNGGVVVASNDGKLRFLGQPSAPAPTRVSPPLVDLEVGQAGLFLLGAEGLSRFDAADGEERWSRTTVERVACASPALVVVEDEGLRWLSAEGEPRARVALAVGRHRAIACLGDGSLVVGDDTGTLLRVDATGVKARARLPAGRLVSLDPTAGGLLIAGYRDGRVLAARPPS
ncbi:MAG TPA: PQQ-binding-like beta-propeller repeat protein [Polyangiaceae bacterium]|nr:PQQ-binding-like beta-propeller repeat protein [Polyangiaceae bacterium]